jgi:hypothetical protein
MSERRYNEEEVAAIFAKAAEAQDGTPRPVSSATGMTLSELQEIGREVGISAEAIANAAGLVGQNATSASRKFLGLPIGVGMTIDLGRTLTEKEWEQFVVDLRETFDARGTVRSHGSLRQWTNGNLQALLEPTATGQRLRLQTIKGSARNLIVAGLGTIGAGAVSLVGGALAGALNADSLGSIGSIVVVGLGLMGMAAIRLPSWARLRRRQMDGLVTRLTQMLPRKPEGLPASEHKSLPEPEGYA